MNYRAMFSAALLAGVNALVGTLGAQQASPGGIVTGRVTDAQSGSPIAAVTVAVQGTELGAITGSDGTYRIARVPNGSRTIVARRLGYGAGTRTVAVSEGQSVTADFTLQTSAVNLQQVVVTGTAGNQTRAAQGAVGQIRLASGLEAQYIAAEAALHSSGSTSAALTLINTRRTAGGQGAYGGATDTLSVVTELLNQRARDFWLEGKKLGDLRRNPSVALASVLTDPTGSPFYAPSKTATFGGSFCAPIPPQETGANPNFGG